MDPLWMSALEMAGLVRAGVLSPVGTIEAMLARVERLNPAINAFVSVRADGALADAKGLAERIASGEEAGPLAGVPFTVKDLAATEDAPLTHGSRALAANRPGVDATFVRRLKRAGAILIGKTNTPEFGARPTTENELFGATRNPWNLDHTPGGSSGGAGAACAAGISPLAQGSDGGGSIRIPASCCGVVGIKPTRGRVTMGPLRSESWSGLSVIGPIARTVADAAAMLDVMAGPSPGDVVWAPPPEQTFLSATRERAPRRIAVCLERDGIAVDREVRAAVEATASLLSDLGHAVEESAGPPLAPMEEAFATISTVGIGVEDVPEGSRELLEDRTRLIFDVAAQVRAVDYERARETMFAGARQAIAFFDGYDLLLTPTLTTPPPRIGEIGADFERAWEDYRTWLAFTWPFNMTGQPAASIPAGFTSAGLPIGAQLVGRPGEERTIVAVCAHVEEARPWSERIPPLE